MAEKSAFVTGATGFVGYNLVLELLEQGWQVTALHRPGAETSRLAALPVTLAAGDITEPAGLRAAMPEGLDAVFHVAGDVNMWRGGNARQNLVNIDGARHMAETALEKGARRFVLTSTTSAWGRISGTIDESVPKQGGASWINYERSKYLGEQAALAVGERGLEVVIMNPAGIIGPYTTGTWAELLLTIAAGKLPGTPGGTAGFSHVREIVRAHIAAAERDAPGECYLLGGMPASFQELCQIMAREAGVSDQIRLLPGWLMSAMARLAAPVSLITRRAPDLTPEFAAMTATRQHFNDEKARRELGFQHIPLEACVADCANWLRDEGLL